MARAPTAAVSAKIGPISIRMYNVGFGDCFLLKIPTSAGMRNVVIDCGTIKNKALDIGEISNLLMSDVSQTGRPHIDVLVMSHRHADHITGFDGPAWSELAVDEIWMPWIESRTDPRAKAMRRKQADIASALEAVSVRLLATLNAGEAMHAEATAIHEIALNAKSNQGALDRLHEGFSKRVRPEFLPKTDKVVERYSTPNLPGVEVFVLGPPFERAALNLAEPPKNSGQVLLTGLTSNADDAEKFRPFADEWVVGPRTLSDFDAEAIDSAASKIEMYQMLAAELDAEINNTSLVLMFRVGRDYLLFPGDAQWGPWERILADDEARELLEKVTFLKVSHHASHNGTPAGLVRDLVGRRNVRAGVVRAMVSMTPHGAYRNIPHHPILELMIQKGFPCAVSDSAALPPEFSGDPAGRFVDTEFDPI